MENAKEEQKDKAPDNEQYDVNNPQNLTQPVFNSTTEHREGADLPAIENLNQTKGLDSDPKNTTSDNSAPSRPENDESQFGNDSRTDLGQGKGRQDVNDKGDDMIVPSPDNDGL